MKSPFDPSTKRSGFNVKYESNKEQQEKRAQFIRLNGSPSLLKLQKKLTDIQIKEERRIQNSVPFT